MAFDTFFVCLHLPESNSVTCTTMRVTLRVQVGRGELLLWAGSDHWACRIPGFLLFKDEPDGGGIDLLMGRVGLTLHSQPLPPLDANKGLSTGQARCNYRAQGTGGIKHDFFSLLNLLLN